jgi:hypothetical protein
MKVRATVTQVYGSIMAFFWLFAALHPLNVSRKFVALDRSPLKMGGGALNRAPPSPMSVVVVVVVMVGTCAGVMVNWGIDVCTIGLGSVVP